MVTHRKTSDGLVHPGSGLADGDGVQTLQEER